MGDWSPGTGGGDWLLPPQWALDEELPRTPASVPTGNGNPEPVPYTYRGGDFSEPPEVTVRRRRRTAPRVREATGLDDPALAYALCPVSAPAWFIHDYEENP